MDLNIRGRQAIVCASSQGLGKACAFALAEAGVAVVINARNRARLESAAGGTWPGRRVGSGTPAALAFAEAGTTSPNEFWK